MSTSGSRGATRLLAAAPVGVALAIAPVLPASAAGPALVSSGGVATLTATESMDVGIISVDGEVEVSLTGTVFSTVVGCTSVGGNAGHYRCPGVAHVDVHGSPEDDSVYGEWANVSFDVDGGAGDDWISTGPEDDDIEAGPGSDEVFGDFGDDLIDGGDGDDNLWGDERGETVRYSGHGDDTLTGGNGNDELYPQGGTDVARGGAGVDGANYVEYVDPPGDSDSIGPDGDVEDLSSPGASSAESVVLVGNNVANVLETRAARAEIRRTGSIRAQVTFRLVSGSQAATVKRTVRFTE